ncbi:hypothetical protein HanIR_Chr13g0654801 [Helianthus annuus]|nr:hypothetical protein HanIR_Chr13g0654801 [Helianthus annuus]
MFVPCLFAVCLQQTDNNLQTLAKQACFVKEMSTKQSCCFCLCSVKVVNESNVIR